MKRTDMPQWRACPSCKEDDEDWIERHEKEIQACIDAYEGDATDVYVSPPWCEGTGAGSRFTATIRFAKRNLPEPTTYDRYEYRHIDGDYRLPENYGFVYTHSGVVEKKEKE